MELKMSEMYPNWVYNLTNNFPNEKLNNKWYNFWKNVEFEYEDWAYYNFQWHEYNETNLEKCILLRLNILQEFCNIYNIKLVDDLEGNYDNIRTI